MEKGYSNRPFDVKRRSFMRASCGQSVFLIDEE
jgi:hypothetical protein